MNRLRAHRVLICAICLSAPVEALATTIATVSVGDVANTNAPSSGRLYGGVSYARHIGVDDFTYAGVANFLCSQATSEPLGLFFTYMSSNVTAARDTRPCRRADTLVAISQPQR